jgi:hypothetical protein
MLNFIDKKNKLNLKFNYLLFIPWKDRFYFFKKQPDLYSKFYYDDTLKKKIINDFEPDEKINFINDYIDNLIKYKFYQFGDDYTNINNLIKFIFNLLNKLGIDNYFINLEFNVMYEFVKTKYFHKLDDTNINKLTEYKLDYNSHYELYKLDEKKIYGNFII